MPRPPKPYPHRGWFVSNLGGQRHKLCRIEEGLRIAQEALGDLLKQHREGGLRNYAKLTVAELFAIFLASREGKITPTHYRCERLYLSWFAACYGDRQVVSITRLEAQQFMDGLRDRKTMLNPHPLRPKTINHVLTAIRQAWKWAIDTELIPAKNPFDKIRKLETEGRQRVMTAEEFQALMRHASTHFRRVLLMLRFTSMRPGELRKLTWAMIQWDHRRLVIARHKTSRKTGRPRIIPLPDTLFRLLRWLEAHKLHPQFVFVNRFNLPWTINSITAIMAATRDRAGIRPDENGEMLVLYSTRHTFITAAASNGIDGPMLENLAGHTNSKMTAYYAHLANQTIGKAADRVAQVLRPVPRPDGTLPDTEGN